MVAEVVDEPGRENIPEVRLKKLCADCGTSETPLWRGGPAGPKSLCNACGVRRNRKKRRAAVLELTKSERKASKAMKHNNSTGSCISNSGSGGRRNGHSDSSAKDCLIAVWDSVKPRNVGIEELSEEQQAALLLMTLSHEFKHC